MNHDTAEQKRLRNNLIALAAVLAAMVLTFVSHEVLPRLWQAMIGG